MNFNLYFMLRQLIHTAGFCFCFCVSSPAQMGDSSYAEKLGFAKEAKVLILHVDDAGMSFESNEGTVQALTIGAANSCSVMMPCGWVPQFVQFLKQHPTVDAGLHLTLTAEWKQYRWGPVAGKAAVPGLVDSTGNLWASVANVVAHASPGEVAKELEAQLDRARSMGFEPTHLESHMGTLFATPAFMERYVMFGIKHRLPVLLPAGHLNLIAAQANLSNEQGTQLRTVGETIWNAGLPVIDDLYNGTYDWKPAEAAQSANYKIANYINALRELKPGITLLIMHCTATSETFDAISDSGPSRQADLDAMLDPAFKEALQKQNIVLTTWRELMQRRSRVKAGD